MIKRRIPDFHIKVASRGFCVYLVSWNFMLSPKSCVVVG